MNVPSSLRLKFEKWAKHQGEDICRTMLSSYPPKDGGYASKKVEAMWQAWKAAFAEFDRATNE